MQELSVRVCLWKTCEDKVVYFLPSPTPPPPICLGFTPHSIYLGVSVSFCPCEVSASISLYFLPSVSHLPLPRSQTVPLCSFQLSPSSHSHPLKWLCTCQYSLSNGQRDNEEWCAAGYSKLDFYGLHLCHGMVEFAIARHAQIQNSAFAENSAIMQEIYTVQSFHFLPFICRLPSPNVY